MSDYHIKELRAVETRMEASRAALTFVVRNWHLHEDEKEMTGRKPDDFRQSLREVEAVYVVSLYATFEGLLREHLAVAHSHLRLTKQTKIDRIIFLVCQAEAIALDPVLRNRLEEVRDYRNQIAHGTQANVTQITFRNALNALNHFVAKLPAPRR